MADDLPSSPLSEAKRERGDAGGNKHACHTSMFVALASCLFVGSFFREVSKASQSPLLRFFFLFALSPPFCSGTG